MNGDGVRGIRIMDGLTQAEFARKLRVSPQCISDVENGKCGVSPSLRIKIAQAYGTGPDVIEAIERAKAAAKLGL